jgi:hypothetical protein
MSIHWFVPIEVNLLMVQMEMQENATLEIAFALGT